MAKKAIKSSEGSGGREEAAARPYVVLARKYRPQTFDDLIGQEAMVRTLRNAFASGRIAQGFMLTGVRGVGKTTTARILARALNYETDGVHRPTIDMPDLGRHCAEIMESRHPDVIEMDAASNTGIENMREIIESARYLPILARTKVYIIDEVHMLSKSAFNALLKTLEEPPEHVKFVFATTEIRKVPVTVLSRCQRFDLRRVDVPELVQHFRRIVAAEGAKADDDALALIARAAEGSVRDGLSILDQAIATGSGAVTAETVRSMLGLADRGRVFDLLEQVFGGETAAALGSLASLYRDGAEPSQLLSDLAEAVHIATRIKTLGPEPGSEALSAEERRRGAALGARLSVPLLARAWQMLVKGIEETARAPDPAAAAEMVLIRLAYTADLPPPDEIIKALGGESLSARREVMPVATPDRSDHRRPPGQIASARSTETRLPEPTPAPPTQPDELEMPPAAPPAAPEREIGDDFGNTFGEDAGSGPLEYELADVEDEGEPATVPAATGFAQPRSFSEVVALAGHRRDARLKVHLEEHVSLVKFDAGAGSIDVFLLPGAPPEIANELREKLNRWTGRRWMIMLSKSKGAPTVGEVRREREAAELAEIREHPAVRALFEEFPDAKIAEVRPLSLPRDDEAGTG